MPKELCTYRCVLTDAVIRLVTERNRSVVLQHFRQIHLTPSDLETRRHYFTAAPSNHEYLRERCLQRWCSTSREKRIMACLAIHSRYYYIRLSLRQAVSLTVVKACVVPRPIGWISTRNNQTGVDNLAPCVEHGMKLVETRTRTDAARLATPNSTT